MLKRCAFCFLFLWVNHSSFALEVSSPSVLDLDIARDGLTRIEIEGETIEDVFVFPPHVTSHFMLHKKGHLFFTGDGLLGGSLPSGGLKEFVSVTLLTSSGIAQDLRLHLTAQKAQPILLKAERQSASFLQNTPTGPTLALLKPWLKTFLGGKIPAGFRALPINAATNRAAVGLEVTPAPSWTNDTHSVESFVVRGTVGVLLDAALLSEPGDLALVFAHTRMPEGGATTRGETTCGETTLYVVRPLLNPHLENIR